ncbi:MAG: AAA family ATPase [Lachnospiraceae bacterium]|nr:hypothetical protein [Sarcina sp.]MBR2730204.1 AAA family ATPase [Lachnospiraceae bacterium]
MIRKIVITGGPCAGKTTGMSWIQKAFEAMGYLLLFLTEPATEMKTAGITPARCSSSLAYQIFQMKLQFEKEKIFESAARDIEAAEAKVLIVCDRGFLDNRAYMTDEEFDQALRVLGVTEEELLAGYDAVFHLETTAKNALIYYGAETNAVRDEDPAQAAALDDRVIAAWSKHPYFRIIENLNGFEDKMDHLVAEIAAFLGEPVPYEIRRRYLLEYPDPAVLENIPGCHREEIEQVYLRSAPEEEIRIRRRVSESGEMFYLTRKRLAGGKKRLEAEGRLTEREYGQFLSNADPQKRLIRKTRYCLAREGQYFAIDLYPFRKGLALLEVSLREEGEPVQIPPFVRALRDVTEDPRYEIAALADRGPES